MATIPHPGINNNAFCPNFSADMPPHNRDAQARRDREAQLEKFLDMRGSGPIFVQALPSRAFRIIDTPTVEDLSSFIDKWEAEGSEAIFYGINPFKPGMCGAPKGEDIECRRWLFLDVDHPDHDQKIPATDEGKLAACEVAKAINVYLATRDWPAPIKIDSGNGPHCYWCVDLPNDEATTSLVRAFLKALRSRFGPLVDDGNHDARRLGRVPGSLNRRGEATAERPYRLCRILESPVAAIVTVEQIQGVIDEIAREEAPAPTAERVALKTPSGVDISPGDDFNSRATWAEILEPCGGKIDHRQGEVVYWTRPGKQDGTSATTGYCKGDMSGDMLYVWSSTWPPFEAQESYSKFRAYTLLNHNGDFSAAAKALAGLGYGYSRSDKVKTSAKQAAELAVEPITIDDVQLRIANAKKTPSDKIVATVEIAKAGVSVDVITMTTAPSNRREAAKQIAKHVPVDPLKIDMAIGKLMLQASDVANQARTSAGENIHDIVSRAIVKEFGPTHRTMNGFFSERRRQEIRRQDFIVAADSRLLSLAAAAVDVPVKSDGTVIRSQLLKAVESELKITYADLMRTLPLACDANLLATSAAGREFRLAATNLFTTPKTWESDNSGKSSRASLISRAASAIRSCIQPGRDQHATRSWKQVLAACACWWRLVLTDDGEIRPLIGIRYNLANQIGIPMPGVSDQATLISLGVKFGVVDPEPPVNPRTNHNTDRIAVLSQEFIDPLLALEGDLADTVGGQAGGDHIGRTQLIFADSKVCGRLKSAVHLE